ncbi:integral membrane protein 2C-like isoform X5 [Lates japonicus]|uniref:Integral membrane protein 2C-like isoform X5 n=1 Tax=Lates japonicus TaxID=270547 RepID=A0AAD3REN1_LATJO|nr:integral membrane protein 2C-like isoform X5 [Lates japonicus]
MVKISFQSVAGQKVEKESDGDKTEILIPHPMKTCSLPRVLCEDSICAPLRGAGAGGKSVGICGRQLRKISVPVPHFGGSSFLDIIRDFHRVRTQLSLYLSH